MVTLLTGKKGSGKTKKLIELAKEAVEGLDGSGFLCRLADTLADRRM